MTNSRAPTACRTSLTRRRSGAQARLKRWRNWWRSWLRMTRASSRARFLESMVADNSTPRGEWGMGSGEWEDEMPWLAFTHSPFPTPYSLLAVDSLQLFNPWHDQHHSD